MEQLFNDLQQQIANKMGNDVSLIDEDYGQLEACRTGKTSTRSLSPASLSASPKPCGTT